MLAEAAVSTVVPWKQPYVPVPEARHTRALPEQ